MDNEGFHSEENARPEPDPPSPMGEAPSITAPIGEPRNFRFEFTGNASEYFNIWIVNLLLTLVTLGFYWPWALVRSRRYLYANTRLDEHAFDYTAKPKSLFYGYLIVLVFAAIYLVAGIFNPLFIYPVLLVYSIAMPWMVFKAFRFRAYNTVYRNIRFKFAGHLGDSYVTYLAWAFLVPFTLGLIIPFWEMKKKEYLMDNLQYGKSHFTFRPQAGEYYKYYLLFIAIGLAVGFALVFVFIALFAVFGAAFGSMDVETNEEVLGAGVVAVTVISYVFFIALSVVFRQGLWMMLFNYNMSVWKLGNLLFVSRMKLSTYLGLVITNTLATIFSLGLLYPWAKVRMTQYRLQNLEVSSPKGDLGEHIQSDSQDIGAMGEAAADFMDFEIGF